MNTIIEDIVVNELKAICGTCAHQVYCVYRRSSGKAIIQCELFEVDYVKAAHPKRGLCVNCDHADNCALPGRLHGVWHCSEFS